MENGGVLIDREVEVAFVRFEFLLHGCVQVAAHWCVHNFIEPDLNLAPITMRILDFPIIASKSCHSSSHKCTTSVPHILTVGLSLTFCVRLFSLI